MPIFDQNDREVVRILDNQGREIETVYDQNGVIVYTNAVEMTGNVPLYFKGRGKPLTDYRISGETLQDGMPSPDYPVEVVSVGDRTENLLDPYADGWITNAYLSSDGIVYTTGAGARFVDVSPYIDIEPGKNYSVCNRNGGNAWYHCFYNENKQFISSFPGWGVGDTDQTATAPANAKYLRCSILSINYNPQHRYTKVMVTQTASIPESYIPYGYKLPITVTNGTDTVTTPIYIGAEPLRRIGNYADEIDFKAGTVIRRIGKRINNGTENWHASYGVYRSNYGILPGALTTKDMLTLASNFFVAFKNGNEYDIAPDNSIRIVTNQNRVFLRCTNFENAQAVNTFFLQQYQNGEPVIFYYVLATPTTESITLPQIPTINGLNTMSVDTTVKPSQMYIKGKIKPDGYGKLTDKNGVHILDKDGAQLTVHGQTDTPNA